MARTVPDDNGANAGSSMSFPPGCSNHETKLSTPAVDLTSIGDVHCQAADSDEGE